MMHEKKHDDARSGQPQPGSCDADLRGDDRVGSRHTPGPWTHYHDKLRPQFPVWINEVQDAQGNAVVAWPGFDGVKQSKNIVKANAHLIAAAPELLEALKHSEQALASLPFDALGMSHDDQCEWPLRDELLTQVRAAIAKAEGRSPETQG